MANDGKFLNITGGVPQQETALTQSTGAANANAIPKLDSTGRLDPSLMPVGVNAEVVTVVATEALAAGAYVNLYNVSGALRVRNADATTAGKPADGFVLVAVANGGTATVYTEGANTAVTGRTPGANQFLAITAGAATETAPTGSGNVAQLLGKAFTATSANFEPQYAITLA